MSLKASRVGSARLREVLAKGHPSRTRLFSGKALPGNAFQFSIVAPKKAFPTAVARVSVRRRCREAFRRAAASSAPVVSLVVTVRPEAAKADFSTLVSEAAELLGCYSKRL